MKLIMEIKSTASKEEFKKMLAEIRKIYHKYPSVGYSIGINNMNILDLEFSKDEFDTKVKEE